MLKNSFYILLKIYLRLRYKGPDPVFFCQNRILIPALGLAYDFGNWNKLVRVSSNTAIFIFLLVTGSTFLLDSNPTYIQGTVNELYPYLPILAAIFSVQISAKSLAITP